MADGSTKTMTLASLGIVTGDYTENGKLHILGDEDDDQYSSETNTLKNLLESGSDIVGQVIGGTTSTSGVGTQMYDYLRKSMTRIEGVRSKWDEKLQNLEDKYYDQFSKMESAMAKLQSQQSYLSSLFGSAS